MPPPQSELLYPPAEWIRSALADIGGATIVVDAAARVLFLNPLAELLTGWLQSEAIGRTLAEVFRIVAEADRVPIVGPLEAVLATGMPTIMSDHTILISRNLKEMRIDHGGAPVRDESGTIVGAVAIFCDVSERQRIARGVEKARVLAEGPVIAAEARELSEIRYRRLFETAQDAILLVDPTTRTIFDANPFIADLLGYTREQLVGRELWEIGLFEDIESNKAAFRYLQSVGYIRYDDLPLQTRDGRGIDVEFVSNVYDVGATRVIQCNIRDVTDRKRAEDALRTAYAGLEIRVWERTAELATINAVLESEIARREVAESDRRDLQQQLTTVQEAERRRISRELHDQMGQHLTALSLGLKFVRDATPEPSPQWDRLQNLQALTDRIGREVHHLALELRPTALDDLGLYAALANYVEGWSERSGIVIDFHGDGANPDRLPAPVETALYRVIQEALTNVLRHAEARYVSVVLQRSPGQVSAVIEDDGRGFDADSVAEYRLGILGMRERAVLVGGTLSVESGPGRGTTVIARIPLRDDEGGTRRG